jgi:hypothetical protein
VVLYAARHRVPVPSLARWLLGLGIAATLTANMAQGWSHGPVGAVVAAWPAVSLVGSYELLVWLFRTCGPTDRGPSAEHLGTGAPCRAAARSVPASAADGERPGGNERDAPDPAGRPAGQAAGQAPTPASGSVRRRRRLRPALSMTRRWPRTGSACRPVTRCQAIAAREKRVAARLRAVQHAYQAVAEHETVYTPSEPTRTFPAHGLQASSQIELEAEP